MFKLDNDFLVGLGLGSLPVDEKNRLLQVIYERLEMNVGMRLAEKMTDQQLDEFEGFIDRNDEAGALHWLETNFPNYKDVVAEELEKLKKEVGASAPQILAAAQGNAPQATPMGQPVAQPQQFQPAAPSQPSYSPAVPQQPYAQPQTYQQPQPQFQPAPQAPQNPSPAPQQFQPAPAFSQPNPPQPQFQPQAPYPTQPAPQPYTQPQPPDPYVPPMPTQQPPAGPGL